MFYLISGLFCLLISAAATFSVYGTDAPVTVNGQVVSNEGSVSMLGPKILILIFWIVGFALVFVGIRMLVTNKKTQLFGRETFGIVTDLNYNGTSVNGRCMMDATVVIVTEHNTTDTYIENIGFNKEHYQCGDYVKIKHYKKDINIIGHAQQHEIPYYQFEMLQAHSPYNEFIDSDDEIHDEQEDGDFVILNGKKYRRVD